MSPAVDAVCAASKVVNWAGRDGLLLTVRTVANEQNERRRRNEPMIVFIAQSFKSQISFPNI